MIVLFMLFSSIFGHMFASAYPETYILSRDCQTPPKPDPLSPYPSTRLLRVDNLETALILYSHEAGWHGTNNNTSKTRARAPEPYPHSFSCEVVVHTPVQNARIMLQIDQFYVPSSSDACVENYLYVFDSNTAKSKAMPEAGGERGLCRASYPREPVFTTNPYICFAFHTSIHRPPKTSQNPGFRLILTVVQDTKSDSCQAGNFYCGSRPNPDIRPRDSLGGTAADQRLAFGSTGSTGPLIASDRHGGIAAVMPGYCISPRTVCDNVKNCADGRDEVGCEKQASTNPAWVDPGANGDPHSWITVLLSLGIAASIAIAVSTIVTFTVCIGIIICCCYRCCNKPYAPRPGNQHLYRQHPYQSGIARSTTVHTDGVLLPDVQFQSPPVGGRGNLVSWLNGTRRVGYPTNSGLMSPFYTPAPGSYYAGANFNDPKMTSAMLMNEGGKSMEQNNNKSDEGRCVRGTGQRTAMSVRSGGAVTCPMRLDRSSPSGDLCPPPPPPPPAQSAILSSDSYSSIHATSRGYLPGSIGPPMGSPGSYRRDQLGMMVDRCGCYTPPPYGVCTVPPASSVTASSSRTGTTSGGGVGGTGVDPRHHGWHHHAQRLQHPAQSPPPTYMASVNGDLAAIGGDCNGLFMFNSSQQQLSGGGNSALHTNTPVETISQGGCPTGDLVSNGGILYLGEVYQPFGNSTGPGIVAGSTTTGSGSSLGGASSQAKPVFQHRLFQRNHQSGDMSHEMLTRSKTVDPSAPVRRQRAPSHPRSSMSSAISFRQHRRHHRSADPIRPANHSSGSHTPASSRSGLPRAIPTGQPVGDSQDSAVPISFPVQL